MSALHTVQSALAMSLLHSLWQVAVLSMLAASLLSLLQQRSAAIRHVVAMAFLLLMAAAPVATFAWLIGQPAIGDGIAAAAPSWTAQVALADVALRNSISAPNWLPWLWCAGVLAMAARMLGGWWVVHSLDREAFSPLPAHWQQRTDALRRKLGIRRQVAVRLLQRLELPCSARAWRPVVWLPVSILTRLDPDQVEALIAHELAHIRRLDWVWNGLQCAVEALLFYHPGMWWLSHRIRQERENACDDMAVAVCGDAIVLAEALATLEHHRMSTYTLALSATGGPLMKRVARLLYPNTNATGSARLRWAIPMGVIAAVCSGALLAAQLQSPQPTVAPQPHAAVTSVEHHTPAPPPPPAPPAPPAPPSAALPPAPPAPPAPTDTAAYQSALRSAQADAGVIALVGSPVIGMNTGFDLWIGDDNADLTFPVSGPKGTTQVHVQSELQGDSWTVATLEVSGD